MGSSSRDWATGRSTRQCNAGVNEGNTNVSPPLPPWALLCCWNGVARLMGLVMMNVAILLNGNRTLTKSCLLFVTLLNVKSSNQSPSSQNEINLTAHTVKMSNHDSYFHLKKKKKKSLVATPPPLFPSCSVQALQWSSCSLGSTRRLAAGPGFQAWLHCTRLSGADPNQVCTWCTPPHFHVSFHAPRFHLLSFMLQTVWLQGARKALCLCCSEFSVVGIHSSPPCSGVHLAHGPHALVSSTAPFLPTPLLMLSPASLPNCSAEAFLLAVAVTSPAVCDPFTTHPHFPFLPQPPPTWLGK